MWLKIPKRHFIPATLAKVTILINSLLPSVCSNRDSHNPCWPRGNRWLLAGKTEQRPTGRHIHFARSSLWLEAIHYSLVTLLNSHCPGPAHLSQELRGSVSWDLCDPSNRMRLMLTLGSLPPEKLLRLYFRCVKEWCRIL